MFSSPCCGAPVHSDTTHCCYCLHLLLVCFRTIGDKYIYLSTRMRLLVLCVSTLLALSLFSSMMPSATASPTLTQGGSSSSSSSSSSHAAENSTVTSAPITTTTATTAITTATTTAPMGIVIVAQARSGSTVLGEIFRENEVRPVLTICTQQRALLT